MWMVRHPQEARSGWDQVGPCFQKVQEASTALDECRQLHKLCCALWPTINCCTSALYHSPCLTPLLPVCGHAALYRFGVTRVKRLDLGVAVPLDDSRELDIQ
jgi:hypothetical protein